MTYQMKSRGAALVFFGAVLPSALFMFSTALIAQTQSGEPSVTATDQSAERAKAAKNEQTEKGRKEPVAKQTENTKPVPNFRPSEEISEDSPVPFPVDI